MEINSMIRQMAVDHMRQTRPKYAFGFIVVPFCIFMAYSTEEYREVQIGWLLTMHFVAVIFLFTLSVRTPHALPRLGLRLYHHLIVGIFFVFGCLWGLAIFLYDTSSTQGDTALIVTVAIGVISAVILPGVLWNMLVFALAPPMLVAAIGFSISQQTAEYYWLMLAIMLFSYVLFDGVIKQKQLVIFSIELQHRNEQLLKIAEIQKELAVQANENKSRFLAAASHDLRQPLHAIGLFCSTLTSKLSSSDTLDTVASIQRAVLSLDSYLSSLLDISKLDAGVIQPSIHCFELSEIVEKVSVEIAAQAKEKGLRCDVELEPCVVASDATFMEIILRNLMSNAVRYTSSGGISVYLYSRDDQALITVSDTGIGIAPQHHKDIFKEFWQLANPERDNSKGLGLGLAMVDRLCKYLKIGLKVESELGMGSKFMLSLPISQAVSAGNFGCRDDAPNESTDRITVLVLDNHRDVLAATVEQLQVWGYEVCAATTLDEARQLICGEKMNPSIILTDFRLSSEYDGIQVLSDFGRTQETPFIGIIQTGESAPAAIELLKRSDYRVLFKPVPPLKLRSALVSATQELKTLGRKAGHCEGL